uniref:Macro domain-containing protein n=1 Tax=Salmo trutta TaxID=8032 RepID=A0A673ZTD1_SALTR
MAKIEKILLEEELVSILGQCGPALTNVLHSKFGCTAVLYGVGIGAGKFKKPGEERFSTQLSKVDAVVNAANVNLSHGGVQKALRKVVTGKFADAMPELSKTVKSILKMVEQEKLQSVAIPAISSGLFNFPLPICADVILIRCDKVYEGIFLFFVAERHLQESDNY